MIKLKIKKGDEVVVISGDHKSERGKVLEIDRKRSRVRVEGVNVHRKTLKRSQENPRGGLIEREMPMHISNVMLAARYEERRQKREGATQETPASEPAPAEKDEGETKIEGQD